MDPLLDEVNPSPHDLAREELRTWLIQLNVMDAWRTTFPTRREFTGPNRRNRIDYCFLSPRLLDDYFRSVRHVTDCTYLHEDHLSLQFRLQSPTQPAQSKLPWKCPRWLLSHDTVKLVLERTLDQLGQRLCCDASSNPGALLDEHKRADAIFLRQIFHELKNQDQEQLRHLQQSVSAAKARHATNPDQDSSEQIQESTAALAAFQDSLRSRRESAKFDHDIREGETGSAYFLRPPTPPDFRVSIPSVRRPDNSEATDAIEMAALHRNYWGSIFQSPSEDLASRIPRRRFQPLQFLQHLAHTTKRLRPHDQRFLDSPLTAHDFYWAITKSPKGRSSGLDGLPVEYYQLFPSKWARIYEMVYASQFAKGRMTKFQRRAYISLLYKKGDRSAASNYRPITLLNHDAKLGPKILAHRLSKVLPQLVHQDQFGFVKGRSIRHALLQFQDIQEYCRTATTTADNGENQDLYPDAGAVFLDLAKAFDSVLWPALEMVLRHFGFGAFFRHAIKTFYCGTLVTVLVNGTASKYFELGCGVRQGDPLSPGLFILFIEPMLSFLRAKSADCGIRVPVDNTPFHVLAFADDCTGILQDLRYTPRFLSLVQDYTQAAGLRLNVSKTQVLPFRACDPVLKEFLHAANVAVVGDQDQARFLGISQSPTLPTRSRFDRLIPAMVERCQRWKYRARTLRGRAVILRTIVLPLLWYTAAVTPVPPQVASQVVNLCKAFLFKKPISADTKIRGLLPEEWLYWPSTKGGLGLPSIRHFAQTLHLCSLRDAMQVCSRTMRLPRWFIPASLLFDATLRGAGQVFDLLYAPVPRTHPAPPRWAPVGNFWYSALQGWQELRSSAAHTTAHQLSAIDAPLWRNVNFMPRTKCVLESAAPSLACRFQALGYQRLRDFIERFGSVPTLEDGIQILQVYQDMRTETRSAATRYLRTCLLRWIPLDQGLPFGPAFPSAVSSALHGWSFHGRLFISLTNQKIYRVLHSLPKITSMPHSALGIAQAPDWTSMWKLELAYDREVLPILRDLKFRLQHNALGFRHKHRFHTVDINCSHGCDDPETAKHLFWDCRIVRPAWTATLRRLDALFASPPTWPSIVYLQDLAFTDSALERFGRHNLVRVFNVIRCAVLYPTWLHRNDRIYQTVQPSASYIVARAEAYVKLHLQRLSATADDNNRLTSLIHAITSDSPFGLNFEDRAFTGADRGPAQVLPSDHTRLPTVENMQD